MEMQMDEVLGARRIPRTTQLLVEQSDSGGSLDLKVLDRLAQLVALSVVQGDQTQHLRFGEVTEPHEWQNLRKFRLSAYSMAKPYMLAALANDGSDSYDERSAVYAAWDRNEIVASLRLTTYPFESNEHITSDLLEQFLGPNWRSEYLEFSRLLVKPGLRTQRMPQALATYAGLMVLGCTRYRRYFGYTTPIVRRLLPNFLFEKKTIEFQIPSRGTHSYLLLKGDFGVDFDYFAKEKWITRRASDTAPASAVV